MSSSDDRPGDSSGNGSDASRPDRTDERYIFDEDQRPFDPPEPDIWIDEGKVGSKKSKASKERAKLQRGEKVTVHAPKLVDLVGKKRAASLTTKLSSAATAFGADRFPDARLTLKPIVEEVPDLPEARELYGLTLYRLGKWKLAAAELEQFVLLTNHSTEQHPVLADCYRALKRYKRVDDLWSELRDASPSAELVTEGRIVAAGAKADQGNYPAGIATLSKGFKLPKNPEPFHLRRAYALADLYERSGDVLQAKALFGRIMRYDSGYLDVKDRLDSLT